MSYTIRIGFLLAILSVIFGAGIYQGFQIQPKTIIIPQTKLRDIMPPQLQRTVAPTWSGDLTYSSLGKHFPRKIFQFNSANMLWPHVQHQVFTQLVSPVQIQSLTDSRLIFTPSFSDLKTQELRGLFPHRYLHVTRPIVIEQIAPVPQVRTWHLATFFSEYIQLFNVLSQAISQKYHGQSQNLIITPQKTISPAVSLQTPLPVSPISIQSAALMGDEGHTQLVIRLSEKPFYIVRTDNAHKIITLMIDNVNPDISTIPPLDTQGTAIQNISFNVTPDNQFVVTLTLLPQTDVQGLRYKGDNLVIDVGLGAQIPYVQSQQNSSSSSSGPVQPLVKIPVPLSPDELATENYNEAVDLLNQSNTQGAIGLLQMLVTQHPDYLNGRILLSNLLLQQNNSQDALNVLAGAIPQPIFQENPVYYNLLAEAYRQSGDLRAAVKIYQQLLSMNSSNGSWWVGLGMCFEGLGQASAATEAYQKAQTTGNLSPLLQTFVSNKLGSSA